MTLTCRPSAGRDLAPQEKLEARVRELLSRSFDASCAVTALSGATGGDFYVVGGAMRRALYGGGLSGDLDIAVPNGNAQAVLALDALGVPHILNRHRHRRYRWNALQIDLFEPREFFCGFPDVESALGYFDLEANALALHWRTGHVLDPFGVLSGARPLDPGINWRRWSAMSALDTVVLAIRLTKIMHETPDFSISPSDVSLLRKIVLPKIAELPWIEVYERFPLGKETFLRVFETTVLTRERAASIQQSSPLVTRDRPG